MRAPNLLFAGTAMHIAWVAGQSLGAPSGPPRSVTVAVVALHLLMAWLFLWRSPEREVSSWRQWLPALPSLALGAYVSRMWGMGGLEFSLPANMLFCAGAAGTMLSMLALGRSFAVLPGARALVQRGPYRLLRHPMYFSEALMFIAVVLHQAWPLRLLLVIVALLTLAWRIQTEERLLSRLDDHADYKGRVRHRLIPGIW